MISVPEEKADALNRRLNRPTGLLSPNSTPRSTPRSTPIRSMSPLAMTHRSTGLNVTQQKHQKFMSPKFYAVPHGRCVEERETVRFQCAIAGHPTPWTTWDKDGQIVTPTTRISVVERDDLRILEIEEVTFEDAGLYRITLENEYGRVEATARLDVISSQRRDPGYAIHTSASPRRDVSISRRVMGNSTRIGGRLALSTSIRGTSMPSRRFYHNGEEIDVNDRRMTIDTNDATVTLSIDNVRKSDEGCYTCIAQNEFGMTATSTYITFFQEESEMIKQAPEFVRPLESTRATEGCQFVDLMCQVQSFSPFDVQWKRNGKFIDENDEDFR